MIRAHKIRLYPNNKQVTYFKKACGCSRFAYNWGLNKWKELYGNGEKPTVNKIDKLFNVEKKERYLWTKEVTKWATQMAIKEDLKDAFNGFYKKIGKYPKFKKRGIKDSFRMYSDVFETKDNSIWIPKLGWVRMAQPLRFSGKLLYGTISRKVDKWFISISVEIQDKTPVYNDNGLIALSENQAVGVDLGVSNLVTLSNGNKIEGIKAYKSAKGKLRRRQKDLSRKVGSKKGQKKSKNYQKAQIKLGRAYDRVFNLRNDQLHKITSMLTKQYAIIGIEDLNVSGMLKNYRLAGSIQDMSFYEFRRQLDYKAKETGSKIIVADRFFPSSKTCSSCGGINKELRLSDRRWVCSDCGTEHDRDVNAAINLKNNAVGVTVSACGDFLEVISSMKQESSCVVSEACKSGEKHYNKRRI